MTVSVMIVNYNTAALTRRCIESVIRHTAGIDYEIILVDNHSAERSIELVAAAFPEVLFLQSPHNAGFGAACNLAAQHAKGAFFFFLNPDAELLNNALPFFVDFWRSHESSLSPGSLGALLSNGTGQPIHSGHGFPDPAQLLRNKFLSLLRRLRRPIAGETRERDWTEGERYRKIDYVTGADLFVSRSLFVQMQGFDPVFFLYFEETDLQFRLRKIGRQAYLINGPRIRHEQGQSLAGAPRRLRVLYRDSLLRYVRKHQSGTRYAGFLFLWNLLDAKTLMQKLLLTIKPEQP